MFNSIKKYLQPAVATVLLLCACKTKTASLFNKINAAQSGITFNNKITETDSINPISVVNVYNGAGAGIGDFNNDGLQDVYFTGNMVPGRLYLNKGNFKFKDVTAPSGTDGMGRWARGVAVIDINNDGWLDLYLANTIYNDSLRRRNILYINQGADKEGVPVFKDMAAAYGLDINVQSTMANFFDYDNDLDLDVYITVNEATAVNENQFGKGTKSSKTSRGKLLQNNWDSATQHPFFTDVSLQAGLLHDGLGHAATIADINLDGWKDIYISNDFLSDNVLYINNKNGTFTNRSKQYFKHTSFNAMGQDVIDINNDGLSDVVELDMNPKDNYRKKMMLGSNNYNTIQNFETFNYQYQYVRNTLQLNQGFITAKNDSANHPVFSEIGFMSGIAQTDWSWTPLLTDFDNDGYRDMLVTNGFPRDITDHDFMVYRKNTVYEAPIKLLDKIPQVKLPNYVFKNTNGLIFNDVTTNWGLTTPSFSNGAAYADFDNDGDMDMVINNINDEAFLYENTLRKKEDTASHFLQIKCKGSNANINGIGAWVLLYYNNGQQQAYENTPYRGYLSSNQNMAHFGLGKSTLVDSVVIKWPGNKKQTITQVKADTLLEVNIADAADSFNWSIPSPTSQPVFEEVTVQTGIDYLSRDADFADFNIQATLPHKLSEYHPALAAGDVDGNGLDDMVVGGNAFAPAVVFLQQANGRFTQKFLQHNNGETVINAKDEGLLLFDADGNGTLDLYIASGGYKYEYNSPLYADRLYLNDGKGNFVLTNSTVLPQQYTSKLCVKALDFNNDNKLDLFVSGRVHPWKYPQAVSSFIYRNDTENGKVKFTDVTAQVAPALQNIGMVCDALVTDFDNDNQQDLLLTGEWMPITFLKNNGGTFKNVTATTGIGGTTGWWNSIVAGDFRHTGLTDYIVGNAGLNTIYQATESQPVYITAKDFDNTGGYVPVLSYFLPNTKGVLQEFPAQGRDDILERIPSLRKRYNTYQPFASATMQQIFTPTMQKNAQRLNAVQLQSCYLRNQGNGRFTLIPLPLQAQISTINGMLADDFDDDGNLDVLIAGNDYGTEVSVGRYDALNGLLLTGDGNGNFEPQTILQSGFYLPGNGKALVKLRAASGKYLVAGSQYKGPLKLFELNTPVQTIPIQADDVYAIIKTTDGKTEKKELYYGTSFLSQSSRFIKVPANTATCIITNNKGQTRNAILAIK